MKYIRHDSLTFMAFLAAIQFVSGASGEPGASHYNAPLGLAQSGWPKDRGDVVNAGRSNGRGARGRLRWVFHAQGVYRAEPTLGPNHTVYVGSTANVIYCLGQRDGHEMPGFEAGVRRMDAQEDKAALHARIYDYVPYNGRHGSYGIPTIGHNGTVYVGSDNGKFYALDGSTGRKVWVFKLPSGGAGPATVGGDGSIYFGSSNHDAYALDGANGRLRWKYQTSDEVSNTPALGPDGTLYVGSRDTFVYALNARTGRLRWKFAANDVIYSAVALGPGGLAYAACKDGYIYAFDARSGRRIWATRLRGEVFDDPALGGGAIYIVVAARTSTSVYALDGRTGSQRWTAHLHPTGGGASSIALAADGTVYAVTDRLYALDGRTGRTKWVFDPHSPIGSPAVGPDGTVYFATLNSKLYAVK